MDATLAIAIVTFFSCVAAVEGLMFLKRLLG